MINVWIFVVMVLLLLCLVMMVIISMETDALLDVRSRMDTVAICRSTNKRVIVCIKEDQFNLSWIVFINIQNLILQKLYWDWIQLSIIFLSMIVAHIYITKAHLILQLIVLSLLTLILSSSSNFYKILKENKAKSLYIMTNIS